MRAGVLAVMVALLALFAAPRAEASYLYWTSFAADAGNPGTVGRANIDGSGANNNFISAENGACGVAADSNHVYWGPVRERRATWLAPIRSEAGSSTPSSRPPTD